MATVDSSGIAAPQIQSRHPGGLARHHHSGCVGGCMEDSELPHKGLAPLEDGLWFIAEAAFNLAQQQGMELEGRHDLARRFGECAKLPTDHPLHLRTRHLESKLPRGEGEACGLALGVYPADVNDWLRACGVLYRWSAGPTSEATAKVKAVPRAKAQEEAILRTLSELGINPLAWPNPPKGKQCPVKKQLTETLGFSSDVMKKALTRLRSDRRIVNAEEPR